MKRHEGATPSSRDQSASPLRNAISDRVYAVLRSRIIDLEFEPGARLQIERISAEFDVSPSPVREALNRLAAEGLVSVQAYRGFRVSDLLDRNELKQLLEAREAIEVAAAREAALRSETAIIDELDALVARMDALASQPELDVKEFNATDASFHRTIVQASGNRFLVQAFDSLHSHVQIARHFQGRSVAEARLSNEEHGRLLDALRHDDADRVGLEVAAHLGSVVVRLREGAAEQPGEAS